MKSMLRNTTFNTLQRGHFDQEYGAYFIGISIVSSNQNFDDIDLPIEFIKNVWLVLAKYEKSTT